jgi:phosphohistidine phosphatase
MNLLIIRHGVAQERVDAGNAGEIDDRRALTPDGRTKMAHAAEGLREVAPEISVLASSPLLRAHESAEIIARAYGIEVRSTTDALLPNASFDEFIEWVSDRSGQSVIAVVGHEPHLSTLATWFMCGVKESKIALEKGGACFLSFDDVPKPSTAKLEWLLQPDQLRALAGRGW